MLVGNMSAFAGMLLNAGFREKWWPLACTHIGLNLLCFMEVYVSPLVSKPGIFIAENVGIPSPL